ncbi:MAG: maleylacetoacetate isomerase [Kofleriaceae bacterium]
MKLVLHNYWRSSASHRVRIALHLKQLPYDYVAVNIAKQGQFADAYRAKNPMSQVPTLEITEDDGTRRALVQSLPILEYLEERWPERPILPRDPYLRARARGLAEIVNSGIQPLQNLSTTKKLKELGADEAAWVKGFIADGLVAFARSAAETAGAFCVGEAPTVADCFLVPQLASARRFGVLDGKTWNEITPNVTEHRAHLDALIQIEARCMAQPAFADAAPDRQSDAIK